MATCGSKQKTYSYSEKLFIYAYQFPEHDSKYLRWKQFLTVATALEYTTSTSTPRLRVGLKLGWGTIV